MLKHCLVKYKKLLLFLLLNTIIAFIVFSVYVENKKVPSVVTGNIKLVEKSTLRATESNKIVITQTAEATETPKLTTIEGDLEKSLQNSDYEQFFVESRQKTVLKPSNYICASNIKSLPTNQSLSIHYSYNPNQKKVLVITKNSNNVLVENLRKIFFSTRIKFKTAENIDFTSNDFSIIVYETYQEYLIATRALNFKNYLLEHRVGVIVFNKNDQNQEEREFSQCQLNDDKFLEEFLYITKFNIQPFKLNKRLKYDSEFRKLFFDDKKYNSKSILKCSQGNLSTEDILFASVNDGIKHVFIGIDFLDHIWMLKILFIDSIRYLTDGHIDIGLTRYMQIDIDDIFFSDPGKRVVPEDVHELIRFQNDLSKNYFNNNEYKFKCVIGYSGFKYQYGDDVEDEGDKELIGILFSSIKKVF